MVVASFDVELGRPRRRIHLASGRLRIVGPVPPARLGSRSKDLDRRGFIHSYGLFWSADEINWFRSSDSRDRFRMLGRLGKQRPTLQVCDFRFQRGIYVLYDDYGSYY